MRTINEIIIHCSATRPDQDITARNIHNFHLSRGWKGIGYHFFIRLDGTIEGGRPLDMAGAHTEGRNQRTIGICYAGGIVNVNGKNKPTDTRTPAQITAIYNLIRTLVHIYPSITKISGHNNYNVTACPCFDALAEYDILLKTLKEERLM